MSTLPPMVFLSMSARQTPPWQEFWWSWRGCGEDFLGLVWLLNLWPTALCLPSLPGWAIRWSRGTTTSTVAHQGGLLT